jgi:apolipoprotein N-acyltransferase
VLNETTPRHLILPVLSGFLSFLCLPAADQGYLAWVALVPLTIYLSRGTGVAPAAFGGFVSGAVQNAGLLLWVPQVMARYGGIPRAGAWGIYALLVALQASFPAAACALTGFCIRRRGRAFLLILPFAWVSTELLECHFPFGGFPWLLMGYSQTNHLQLIQFADLSGVLGMSFLVL